MLRYSSKTSSPRIKKGASISSILKPILFVECKMGDTSVSPHLKYLKNKFPQVAGYQLTYNYKKDFKTSEGIRVVDAYKVLNELLIF